MQAYPLQWPAGRPRTSCPESSRFKVSPGAARDGMIHELNLLSVRHLVISTNIELRRDGLPYAHRREPIDQGVAVYFQRGDRTMCFACDRWSTVGENMHAIAKTIQALRGIERWGSGGMVEQAFAGFLALPAPQDPYVLMGINRNASASELKQAYYEKAKSAHPDTGGTEEKMRELNEAYYAIMKERSL